jgi:hypothetical protein
MSFKGVSLSGATAAGRGLAAFPLPVAVVPPRLAVV